MALEKTLVVIKPDGVLRNFVGEIISRFEKTGLKIIAMKMVWIDEEFAKKHYILEESWAKATFERTKATKEKEGKTMPYKDHMDFGRTIQQWNADFLREGPVVAIALEGPHAVEIARKMVGHTEPRQAAPGTIRGDLAMIESYNLSDEKKRVLRNLVHASDAPETAKREISLWFSPKEIHSYKKDMDKHL